MSLQRSPNNYHKQGLSWIKQKETSDQRLLLTCTNMFSTLPFLFLQITHLIASRTTFRFSPPSSESQLNIASFIVLNITNVLQTSYEPPTTGV